MLPWVPLQVLTNRLLHRDDFRCMMVLGEREGGHKHFINIFIIIRFKGAE